MRSKGAGTIAERIYELIKDYPYFTYDDLERVLPDLTFKQLTNAMTQLRSKKVIKNVYVVIKEMK